MTHYHFIGIGGTGLSPIAQILLEQGHTISGSDMTLSPLAEELRRKGVRVSIGHEAKNVAGADIVIRSSAIRDDNPEVLAARSANLPVLKRSDFMGELTRNKKVLAIAGTHGKTTTTSMMAWVLTNLGNDPSYIIGGVSKNLNSNAHYGKGEFFVIEADEYDGMFLGLKPFLLIITNIEHDHPDFYPTMQEYQAAFHKLVHLIPEGGTLLTCGEDENANKLLADTPNGVLTYTFGFSERVNFKAENIHPVENLGVSFTARLMDGKLVEGIQLKVPGKHNAINALSVFAAMDLLKMPIKSCKKALEEFVGTGRRFDILGIADQVTVINDYAHHPTEIQATLAAAKQQYKDRSIWVVWQPHTYSRTLTLMDGFIHAFQDCEHVIVTEIYQSREQKRNISSADIAPRIHHQDVKFMADFQSIVDYLSYSLKTGDILLVLSAGDADQISSEVLDRLKQREGNE